MSFFFIYLLWITALVSLWWRRGHRKWTSPTQERAKTSSAAGAERQPVLERKMSLRVLFVLLGWFASSEVVPRHRRGKTLAVQRSEAPVGSCHRCVHADGLLTSCVASQMFCTSVCFRRVFCQCCCCCFMVQLAPCVLNNV